MDREEFALRVSARRNQLYRTAYLYLGREADALEAVDEAVYQALRHLRQLREEQYFRDLAHAHPAERVPPGAPAAQAPGGGGSPAGERRAGRL